MLTEYKRLYLGEGADEPAYLALDVADDGAEGSHEVGEHVGERRQVPVEHRHGSLGAGPLPHAVNPVNHEEKRCNVIYGPACPREAKVVPQVHAARDQRVGAVEDHLELNPEVQHRRYHAGEPTRGPAPYLPYDLKLEVDHDGELYEAVHELGADAVNEGGSLIHVVKDAEEPESIINQVGNLLPVYIRKLVSIDISISVPLVIRGGHRDVAGPLRSTYYAEQEA